MNLDAHMCYGAAVSEAGGSLPGDSIEDTVVAVSTATGRGAIGIVRLSGSQAMEIARAAFRPAGASYLPEESHRLHYGHIVDPHNGETIDEVLVAVMRAPRTYTREDVVEINCHGGPVVQRAVLRVLISLGARPAEPGEFTRRAFLNGRIDLTQAESVASIVSARSSAALRVSLRQLEGGLSERLKAVRRALVGLLALIEATVDFSDDDVDELDWDRLAAGLSLVEDDLAVLLDTAFLGRALENGVRTAIVGRPNVGKSSLLNALLMRERAIVSDIPGTTRDTVEELIEIGGIPIHLVDTAGMRRGGDYVEQLGMQRSMEAMEQADLVLAVIDLSVPWDESDADLVRRLDPRRSLVVGNKRDLVDERRINDLSDHVARAVDATGQDVPRQHTVSAATGAGLDGLRQMIQRLVTGDHGMHLEEPVLATERQRSLVSEALANTQAAIEGARHYRGEELICEDIRGAVRALGRMTGEDLTPDLLDEIFSRFCLGK
ncbi:MAG: tRNA uridine-5-carboxymethylaminomethyl(34) synthesis GTPase MnmE [Thermoleophilia bacterium]|jgi:tRNA modification GTPase